MRRSACEAEERGTGNGARVVSVPCCPSPSPVPRSPLQTGFSLIELVAVIILIGIALSVVSFSFTKSLGNAKVQAASRDLVALSRDLVAKSPRLGALPFAERREQLETHAHRMHRFLDLFTRAFRPDEAADERFDAAAAKADIRTVERDFSRMAGTRTHQSVITAASSSAPSLSVRSSRMPPASTSIWSSDCRQTRRRTVRQASAFGSRCNQAT